MSDSYDPFSSGPAILPQSDSSYATPDILGAYDQFKKQQDEWVQQQSQIKDQLDTAQNQATQRGADLDVASRLYKIFDPNIAKSAREYLIRETAQSVGADVKGDNFGNVSKMLMGLDPDTLSNMKRLFAGKLKDASPGEIQQTVKGILSGTIPMSSVLDQVGQQQRADQAQQEQQRTTQTPQPFQPGANMEVQSFEGQRTIPPAAQQASPQLVGTLGLDSTKTYRNSDLIKQGYRIPMELPAQEKLATDIASTSTGLSGTLRDAAQLTQIVKGHPEALGVVGSTVDIIQSAVRQTQGALNVLRSGFKDESDPFDQYIQGQAKVAMQQLEKANVIQTTAENAAVVQSLMISMAYKMTEAENLPGNRLTNAVIAQHLQQIGHSSSPDQFLAVLKSTMANSIKSYDDGIKRQLGASGLDILSRQMETADITNLANSAEILPKDLARSLRDELLRRKEGNTGPGGTPPASPTIEEEQRTLGTLETQKKARDIARADQEFGLKQKQEERAGRQEQLANQREARTLDIQQQHLQLSKEQFAFQKDKAAEAAANERRKEISAAFQHFGAAIAGRHAGASVGGSGGGGGPGQNESAFRLTPAPQRTPPRPPGK